MKNISIFFADAPIFKRFLSSYVFADEIILKMEDSNVDMDLSYIEQEILTGGVENFGSGRGVMARPSGNNSLTFFMNDEADDMEADGNIEDSAINNLTEDMSTLDTSLSQLSQASGEEDNSKQRERVLTDKYLQAN